MNASNKFAVAGDAPATILNDIKPKSDDKSAWHTLSNGKIHYADGPIVLTGFMDLWNSVRK